MTYWNCQHFISFLNSLREYEEGESIKELFDSDSSWETEESQNLDSFGDGHSEKVTFSSCRSSITIETTPITKILNDSISQLSTSFVQEQDSDSEYGTENSIDSMPVHNKIADRMSIGRGSETSDSNSSQRSTSSSDTFNEFVEEVHSALCQIEESTEDLLSMFSRIRPGGRRLSNNPILAIEKFEMNMHKLKADILNALESQESSTLAVEDGESSDEATNHVVPVKHDPIVTPVKSSLRSPKLENSGSKRVRFHFPE
ncbi:hypothetical protein J437_LFUL019725 [Ladona fulva]|uniref:Uncharacterized protein n=1 Tax=Ladona fulva TaxID=123851 RepID=A0A8K0KTK7_LADFU|nr:hypothetical protein J437_LFUL019725 [Ladona fulva]